MKVISGPEPLTPTELVAKVWNAEYKGKTIRQLAHEHWDTPLGAPRGLRGTSPGEVLGDIGLLAAGYGYGERYLHFLNLHKLQKAVPELRPYVATLALWEGVCPSGQPYQKSAERLAADEMRDTAIRNAASTRKAYAAQLEALLRNAEAEGGANKPATELAAEPADSAVVPRETATVIQFPGRLVSPTRR